MGILNKIGSIFVDISGDTSKLEESLEDVKAKSEEAGQAIEKNMDMAKKMFDGAASEVEVLTDQLTQAQNKLAEIKATMDAVGKKLGDANFAYNDPRTRDALGYDKAIAEVERLEGELKKLSVTANTTQKEVSILGSSIGVEKTNLSVEQLKYYLSLAKKEVIELTIQLDKLGAMPATPQINQQITMLNEKLAIAKANVTTLNERMIALSGTSKTQSGEISKLARNWHSLILRLTGYYVAFKAIDFVRNSIQSAAAIEGVKKRFDELNRADILDKLRTATRGSVNDLKLMQVAVQAENFNIPIGLLIKGLELAGRVARQTGIDVDYLTDSFVKGVGRKSPRILDNLQISMVELQQTVKKFGGDFYAAVDEIVTRKLQKMGDVAETSADKFAKLKTSTENLQVSIGQQLTPVLSAVSDALTTTANAEKQATSLTNELVGALVALVKILITVGSAALLIPATLGKLAGGGIISTIESFKDVLRGDIPFTFSNLLADEYTRLSEYLKKSGADWKNWGGFVKNVWKNIDEDTANKIINLKDRLKSIEDAQKSIRKSTGKSAPQLKDDEIYKRLEQEKASIKEKLKTQIFNNEDVEKKAIKDRESAFDKLYSDLKDKADSYYDYRLKQIQKERDEYLKATKDKALVDKWYNEQLIKLEQEKSDTQFKAIKYRIEYAEVTGNLNDAEIKYNINLLEQLKKRNLSESTYIDILKEIQRLKKEEGKTGLGSEMRFVKGGTEKTGTLEDRAARGIKVIDEFKRHIDNLNNSVDFTENAVGSIATGFEAAGRGLASTASNAIQLFGQANSVLQQFLQTLIQVTVQMLIMKAIEKFVLVPIFGASTGGEFLGTDKGVTKLASGGSFIVPQGFPNDSFPLMVESGERVTVTPASQVVNNNFNDNNIVNAIKALNLNLIKMNNRPLAVTIQSDDPTLKVKRDIGIKNNLELSGLKSSLVRTTV